MSFSLSHWHSGSGVGYLNGFLIFAPLFTFNVTFPFHLKLFQVKVISKDHCVVPYKAVTLTSGHERSVFDLGVSNSV